MGMYRTVTALLPCRRCAAPFACEVQFKTDDDYELPHYDEGEPIADLEPNSTYEGITDSLCPDCSIERATDIIAAYAPIGGGIYRIENTIVHPWVQGYKKSSFSQQGWRYLDIDTAKMKRP